MPPPDSRASVGSATVGDALGAATDAIRAAGVDSPRLDAEVLLSWACGIDRAHLVADPQAALHPAGARAFSAAVRRRVRREPVAYIVGRRGFRHLDIEVDPRVLVPRPETELLVEVALEVGPGAVLEVGTGSGAVALAVADEMPGASVTATERSTAALDVAAANASRLGLAGRVRVLQGTVPEGEGFDLVLANLPYVTEGEWPGLAPEITDHEPREALVAGADGLEAITEVVPGVAMAQPPGGLIALEVGRGQASAVEEILAAAGYRAAGRRHDLAGIERMVIGERHGRD